jgi:hypothetical protein
MSSGGPAKVWVKMKMDLYRFEAYEKGRAAREGVIAIVRILLQGAKRSGGRGEACDLSWTSGV